MNNDKKSFAVLIDGGHVRSSFRESLGRQHTAADIELMLVNIIDQPRFSGWEFFRCTYYDAAPYEGTIVNPLDGSSLNYRKRPGFGVANRVFREIGSLLRTDVSLGHLTHQGWQVPDSLIKERTESRFGFPAWGPDRECMDIAPEDIRPNIVQKGVDADIAFDMGMIAAKHQVDDVVLVSRDTDFVPAMRKLAWLGIRTHVLVFDLPAPAEMARTAASIIEIPLRPTRPSFLDDGFEPPVAVHGHGEEDNQGLHAA